MDSENPLRLRLAKHVTWLRIAFGIIWAIDAGFKWTPIFQSRYLQDVIVASQGQPAWILWLFHGAESVIRLDPRAFAVATAVFESLTALGLILGLARRIGYLAGLGFSLVVWALAEGFGGPYTAGSTDIGTGIIYAVVFAALYGLDRAVGPSPWALDTVIERRHKKWRRLAESNQ
jgi:nitrite reductase (NO-forming)